MERTGKLTAARIGHAPAGKHADGDGLTLVVKPSGSRSWVARVYVDGKRREIGIGSYPAVSLDDARWRTARIRAEAALPPMPRVRNHQRALDYRDVPHALETVGKSNASAAARLCLRFVVLTAARSGEARGARWCEIDEAGAAWRIPAERMKSAVEHRVPLIAQALDVLAQARQLDDGSGLVFPSPLRPANPLSWQTLLKLLRTDGIDCTVHGFRSSFKTWVIETTSAPWAVGEAALAHVVGNTTEAAYVRSDLFEQRRALMAAWADFAVPGSTFAAHETST